MSEALEQADDLAQNRSATAKRGRGPGRPFEKGNRANPGGRPKGLARLAREYTDDGETLIRFWVAVKNGEPMPDGREPSLRDSLEASKLLAAYGYGKPAEYAPIEEADPLEIEVYRQPDATRARELAEIVVDLEPRIRASAEQNGQ
jgi:hypothetical protein